VFYTPLGVFLLVPALLIEDDEECPYLEVGADIDDVVDADIRLQALTDDVHELYEVEMPPLTYIHALVEGGEFTWWAAPTLWMHMWDILTMEQPI
jgi:hypothetical protein